MKDAGSIAIGEGSVWTVGDSGLVSRIDPESNTVTATIEIGPDAQSIAVGNGAVWVLDRDVVFRIDPETDRAGVSGRAPSACRSPPLCFASMLRLRADPWMPDFGMGFQAAVEEEPSARASPFVEREDWSEAVPAEPPEQSGAVWFVDGVRRVEVRVIADADGRRVAGLFGSHAVGSVCSDGKATFGDHRVGRVLVMGGGVQPDPIEIEVGKATLAFRAVCEPGDTPEAPLWRLQQEMRHAEAGMAANLAAESGRLVLVDGPLTRLDATKCPVVGVVKRYQHQYLGPEEESLIGRLKPGERTPLFGLGLPAEPVQRYAWYTRVVPWRAPWHDHAGVVRCEVPAGLGLAQAVDVAGAVSGLLPRYAGRPSDPRAPQNLAPVGGLEAWLRHRLGHAGIIRRALMERLSREAA